MKVITKKVIFVTAVCILTMIAILNWRGAAGLAITVYSTAVLNDNWEYEDIDAAERCGNAIVYLVDDYRELHGHYPKTLSEIERFYLIQLSSLPVGNSKWRYENKINYYIITFGANAGYYPSASYNSDDGEWSYNN